MVVYDYNIEDIKVIMLDMVVDNFNVTIVKYVLIPR